MLTQIECQVLRSIASGEPRLNAPSAYEGKSKTAVLLGPSLLARVRGRTVVDFGCGEGRESVELALHGAKKVIGIDIRESILEAARDRAAAAGVGDVCEFVTHTRETADLIVSIDAFEHFHDPAGVLRAMDGLLAPGGEIIASFGPTWYHPLGGHLFSVFPWAHLMFSEAALLRWRSAFKSDGAQRFSEVEGGLNQMTIGQFERLVAASPFRFAEFEDVPIRRMRFAHNRLTREFTTSIVRCRLERKR